jgi:hypothetical protein
LVKLGVFFQRVDLPSGLPSSLKICRGICFSRIWCGFYGIGKIRSTGEQRFYIFIFLNSSIQISSAMKGKFEIGI